jgi:biopolymer transport protein TolR
MVAAPLTNPGVINLPTAEKSALPPTEYIQVTLQPDAAATIGINGQKSGSSRPDTVRDRNALIAALHSMHERNPELPVMISADKEIKYDEVIRVISEAKKLGINRVGLATKQ